MTLINTIVAIRKSRSRTTLATSALLAAAGLASPALADDWSWIAGNGVWSNPANWSTEGVPGVVFPYNDTARIGNLPGVQNSTVQLNLGVTLDQLYLFNGMTLDTNGHQMGLLGGSTLLMGANTHLIVRPDAGLNFHDVTSAQIFLGSNTFMSFADNARLRTSDLSNLGTISGRGTMHVQGGGPSRSLMNNGTISGSNNGGLTIIQEGGGRLDLDGIGIEGPEVGQLSVASPFSVMTIQGDELTDFFSGTVTMGSGSLLNMNMSSGWTADGGSTFNVTSGIAGAAAQIDGGHFDLTQFPLTDCYPTLRASNASGLR